MHHSDFDNSDAYILIYAIDDRQSFEMVSIIRNKLISTSAITRIPMILVGNKIDRKNERVISTEEGRALARAWNVHFTEVSAMDLEVVKKMFEKSIHAMNNVDPTENDNEENSIKSHPNQVNPSSRNGLGKKLNGNVSSKEHSSKPICTIS